METDVNSWSTGWETKSNLHLNFKVVREGDPSPKSVKKNETLDWPRNGSKPDPKILLCEMWAALGGAGGLKGGCRDPVFVREASEVLFNVLMKWTLNIKNEVWAHNQLCSYRQCGLSDLFVCFSSLESLTLRKFKFQWQLHQNLKLFGFLPDHGSPPRCF